MSEYDNVVRGKLRLKGKPLEVKCGGIGKKKKKHQKAHEKFSRFTEHDQFKDHTGDDDPNRNGEPGNAYSQDDYLTPAERRYLQQFEKIDMQRLSKMASQSHRDRIQQFNQHLANLSEHYDIPKVGPG